MKNYRQVLLKLDFLGLIRLPDRLYLKLMYRQKFGKNINFKNPRTFNEKLQWLKLYDRKDIYTTMVDKYEVKKYISNKIGKEYLIPTLGIYDKFDDIDFDKLPKKFVIKCTHDSGGLVIVKDKKKLDVASARKLINNSLKRNFYYCGREWPYKNVKSRIIIEKYMEDKVTKELRDYKFFCFNGKVKCFKIDFDRFINHRANYYDQNGTLLHFGEKMFLPNYKKELNMPVNLNKMIEFAELLSKDIPFLRVDFYEINKNIFFGELTFYPASGFGEFVPEEWDNKLGEMLKLPSNEKE